MMTQSSGTTRKGRPPRAWRGASLCRITALAAVASMLSIGTGLAAGEGGGTAGASSGTPVQAHWVKKKINFVYQGFTTHYSCDGLRDNVRDVLLQLGARKSDMKVHEAGCTARFGHPEPSPAVAGSFYVLEPGAPSSAKETPVKAEWQTVHVKVGRPGLDAAGQCELVDQVKVRILPLFAARDVQFESSCVPHQLMIKGSTLTVRVLKPAGEAKDVARASR